MTVSVHVLVRNMNNLKKQILQSRDAIPIKKARMLHVDKTNVKGRK